MQRPLSLTLLILLAACEGRQVPPPHHPGTKWAAETKAFQDVTAAWGIEALNPDGQRLVVADIDNDGWPDVIVRKVGSVPDQGPTGGTRSIWLLRNTGHKTFEDVTYSSGILATRQPHTPEIGRPGEVYAFADVDNDGDLDAYVGLNTSNTAGAVGETSELLLNDGHGHFTLGPVDNAIRRSDGRDYAGGASFIDFDHDGNVDLWVPQYSYSTAGGGEVPQQNLLFKGDGTGVFTNWVLQAGIQTQSWNNTTAINEGRAHTRTWSGLACDLNGDGFAELMAASYGRAPNQLFQAVRGDSVTFTNRSVASGYAYDDNFSWTDNQFARCYCATNPTDTNCPSDIPPPLVNCDTPNWDMTSDTQKYREGGNSGTTVCADIDNDGHFDLMTSEIQHWWAGVGSDQAEVLLNDGATDVHFDRPGRASMGITIPHNSSDWDEGIMTGAIFDFDNDGWQDLYIGASDYPGNRGLLFHQVSKLQFEPVPINLGIDLHRSHGVVTADFDRDGDLDVLVGTSTARCGQASYPDSDTPCYPKAFFHMFENVLGQDGNWIQLDLEGTAGTNRSAIGALVTVTAGGVTQSKQVDGGHGHFGMQDDLVQHFGLAEADDAQVTIRWPNAALETQSFTVHSRSRYHVKQGAAPVAVAKP